MIVTHSHCDEKVKKHMYLILSVDTVRRNRKALF